jgi:acetyl esterase/lipase
MAVSPTPDPVPSVVASRRNLLMRGVTAIGALLVGGAWSPTDILNNLSGANALVAESVPYGRDARQRLDVYAPSEARKAPVVVFFYGGSWQGGTKRMYRFLATALASHGFVVVIPDYRVYPQVRYPGFLTDGARAVAWSRRNAARFGGDPGRLVVMGHSAGAYIAAMLAYDPRWLGAAGMNARRDLAGFVGLAGPYDFLPIEDPAIRRIFAVRDLPSTQPIRYVSAGEVPSFVGSPVADTLVDPGNSARLAARLRATGNAVTERTYPGASHTTLIGAFSPVLGLIAPVRHDVAAFISQVTSRGRGPGR